MQIPTSLVECRSHLNAMCIVNFSSLKGELNVLCVHIKGLRHIQDDDEERVLVVLIRVVVGNT